MKEQLNNVVFLFPVMLYYAMEALIVGVFISIVWKIILTNFLGDIGYFQIVAIYWIFKMLFFNVFNLLSGFIGNNTQDIKDNSNQKK